MAKLVLLLVFVCFQASLQEEQGNAENGIIDETIPAPGVELLDGADENQWQPEKENDLVEQLAEEEEKWFEELGEILEELDYYSEEHSEEFGELLDEIDKYFDDKYSGENEDNEFEDYDKWFGEDEDEDDDDDDEDDDDDAADDVNDHKYWGMSLSKYPYSINKEHFNFGGNGKGILDLYYSWLLRMQMLNPNKKSPVAKRFSSV